MFAKNLGAHFSVCGNVESPYYLTGFTTSEFCDRCKCKKPASKEQVKTQIEHNKCVENQPGCPECEKNGVQ